MLASMHFKILYRIRKKGPRSADNTRFLTLERHLLHDATHFRIGCQMNASDLNEYLMMPKKKSSRRKTTAVSECVDDCENISPDAHLVQIRTRLVTGCWSIPTLSAHLEPNLITLTNLISRCVLDGESNSILVCGPVGSGKSTLVQRALTTFNQQIPQCGTSCRVVRLDGSILPDIKACLREISRQMCLANNAVRAVDSDEDDDGKEEEDVAQTALSVSRSLQLLMASLGATRSGDSSQGHTGLVFILESFEHLAATRNQMLLYNLFDTCQSYKTPLLVIAISRRLDVVELLEKRVKSRFSHRNITLWNDLTFSQYLQCAQEMLTASGGSRKIDDEWNKSMMLSLENNSVQSALDTIYGADTSITYLKKLLAQSIFALCPHARDILDAPKLAAFLTEHYSRTTLSDTLGSLSLFELILIAAMKNLTHKTEGECFNFEQVYQEYTWFARHHGSGVRPVDKHIALNIFQGLTQLNIILPERIIRMGLKNLSNNYRMYNFMLDSTQAIQAVNNNSNCPSSVKMWASGTLAT